MYYWNDRGEKIIDASSGLFCVAAGHGRKEIADAVHRAAARARFRRAVPARRIRSSFELASRVAELTPGDLNRIFFVNSGSEAVDTAMKVALAYHQARGQAGRTMFVSRERAYHGVNFGGVALSGHRQQPAQVRPGAAGRRAHAPHAPEGETASRRGEGAHGADLADDLLRFVNLYGAENIAACFVEPIAGSTGCLVPPKGYLAAAARDLRHARHPARVRRGDHRLRPHRPGVRRAELRRHARHHDDGEGHHQRRAADGRGRDLASASTTRSWPRRRKARSSSSTATRIRAIPAACAAGLATLDIYRDEGLFERGARAVAVLPGRDVLAARTCRIVTDIRGYGMLAAIDVRVRRRARAGAATCCRRSCSTTASISRRPATARCIAPPLIAEKTHIDGIADILRKTVAAL